VKLKDLFLAITFGVLMGFFSVYVLDSGPQKKSLAKETSVSQRLPASTDQKKKFEIPFLNKYELFLLNASEKKSYLHTIAKTLTRAKKISKVVKNAPTLFNKAWAEVICPIYGLHPAVQANQEACARPARGILISESSASRFHPEAVGTMASGQKYLVCPSGQQMCNPALLGFERHGLENLPRLRCLPEATNENCLALSTNGEEISDSLSLLNEANPDFWDEFEAGVNELCIEEGEFNASDEGCNLIRTQMKHAEREYRNRLTLRYKNLSRAIETERLRGSFSDRNACRERNIDQDGDLGDFNTYGVKFVVSGDTCFRIPNDALVRRTADGEFEYYRITNVDGEEEEAAIVHLAELNTHSDRFINFNCGACNNFVSIENCVNALAESDPDLSGLPRMNDARITIPGSNCSAELTALRNLEVSEEAFRNVADPQNRRSFWETGSVE
jgi:hypothetical protein